VPPLALTPVSRRGSGPELNVWTGGCGTVVACGPGIWVGTEQTAICGSPTTRHGTVVGVALDVAGVWVGLGVAVGALGQAPIVSPFARCAAKTAALSTVIVTNWSGPAW